MMMTRTLGATSRPPLSSPASLSSRASLAMPLCLTVLALSGCVSIVPHLVAPEVTLTSVRFQGGSLSHEQLQLTAHIYNPNDRAIPVQSMTASVDLSGMPFASGQTDAPFVLPAQGTYDVVLDVTADMGNGLIALAGRMSHRDLPYRVHGEVHLQRGLVRLLHFSHEGDLRL
ncbi:MAG TPA: LEA type 2 family protein [Steroidobacteraceae bacterium]|jgi:LEA14-like dessication related protein|nr:LEA type 2 family protein [Steroidobacteraceae bacterium]